MKGRDVSDTELRKLHQHLRRASQKTAGLSVKTFPEMMTMLALRRELSRALNAVEQRIKD